MWLLRAAIALLPSELILYSQLVFWARCFTYNCTVYIDRSPVLRTQLTVTLLTVNFLIIVTFVRRWSSCGQRLLVDTFFQNGRFLVGIFWGWILIYIFCPHEFFSLGEFSWTFFGWILSRHFLMVITNSANTVDQPMQWVQAKALLGKSKTVQSG